MVWPWVDALVYSSLPFVVILCLNILIVRQVIIARQQRECLHGSRKFRQRRPSQEGSTRLTLMLLTISFTFLVTTLPMSIVAIAAPFLDQSAASDLDLDAKTRSRFRLARTVAELLMYSNHAINFYLYCATGQKFRHQLIWMVCYARRSYCRSTEAAVLTAAVAGNQVARQSAGDFASERHSSLMQAAGGAKLSSGAVSAGARFASGLKRMSSGGGSATGSNASSGYQLKQRISGGRGSISSSVRQRQRLFRSSGEASSSSCHGEYDCGTPVATSAAEQFVERHSVASSTELHPVCAHVISSVSTALATASVNDVIHRHDDDVGGRQADQQSSPSLYVAALTSGRYSEVTALSITEAVASTD